MTQERLNPTAFHESSVAPSRATRKHSALLLTMTNDERSIVGCLSRRSALDSPPVTGE